MNSSQITGRSNGDLRMLEVQPRACRVRRVGDPRASSDAARVLAEIEQKIDEFEQRINVYMCGLGIDELNADELEALERVVPSNFETWSLLIAEKESASGAEVT